MLCRFFLKAIDLILIETIFDTLNAKAAIFACGEVFEEKGVDLDGLSLADMQAVEGGISEAVFAVLGVRNSVASRVSLGGTAPSQVRAAIAAARGRL